ncbi:MAG TPA: ABC transporter permease [Candidatus Dormibacteraeota bacterium]|nr:ABC transporter permease [Candidatus Dormibacteraeota bacterium]
MSFLARRFGLFLLTLWAALTINFLIPRLMPGDEATAVLARFRNVNPAALHALQIEFGVGTNQPLLEQYVQYLGNCLTGQFGLTASRAPVSDVVLQGLPWTLGLVGITTVIAFILGTAIGIVSAWRRGGKLDSLLSPLLFIVTTFPVFFVALLLLFVFGVALHWFPLSGAYTLGSQPTLSFGSALDVVKHAFLPAATLVITTAGGWIFTMRNNMVSTLNEDYVRMARAKGLPSWRIMFDYAARNAILPNLTGFAMQLGFILGGSILVEYTFSYPGLGYLFYTGTTTHDLPLQQALFLFYTLAVLVCVLVADIATAVLDPRTRDR